MQGYIKWIDKVDDYDHSKMLRKLKCNKNFFIIGESPSSTSKKLDYIYNS